jgi:hypothetical protein
MIPTMSPAVILVFLLAGLLALVPVWRLRAAGWPSGWLLASWITYGVLILIVMRFAGLTRFVLPILVVAYVAPFVAGPERLARALRGRAESPRPVIDVTPRPPTGIAAAPGPVATKRSGERRLNADPPGSPIDVTPSTPGAADTGEDPAS